MTRSLIDRSMTPVQREKRHRERVFARAAAGAPTTLDGRPQALFPVVQGVDLPPGSTDSIFADDFESGTLDARS